MAFLEPKAKNNEQDNRENAADQMFQLHDTVSFQVSAQSMRRPGRKQNEERPGPTLGFGYACCLKIITHRTDVTRATGRQAERKNFPGFLQDGVLVPEQKKWYNNTISQEIRPVGAAGLTGEDNEWNEDFV